MPPAGSGPDEIPIRVLKECKLTVAEPIYLIWDCSFSKSQVPSYYKESIVTPIHKKDSKFLPQNYRPVSLTSHIVFVKLFERILRKSTTTWRETTSFQRYSTVFARDTAACQNFSNTWMTSWRASKMRKTLT
jgi:hypothetical protein